MVQARLSFVIVLVVAITLLVGTSGAAPLNAQPGDSPPPSDDETTGEGSKDTEEIQGELEMLNKKLEAIEGQLDQLVGPRIVSIEAEIRYLYDLVIGPNFKNYSMKYDIDNQCVPGAEKTGNHCEKGEKDTGCFKNITAACSRVGRLKGAMNEIQDFLEIENRTGSLKDQIEVVEGEIHNPDWSRERVRFGAATTYLSDADAIAASIVVRGYFTSHRYIPGKYDAVNGFTRRLSAFVGVGAPLSSNDSIGDIGLVISAGFSWDVNHAFGVAAGWSSYELTPPEATKSTREDAFTFGVTLNAELWKSLFSGSGG